MSSTVRALTLACAVLVTASLPVVAGDAVDRVQAAVRVALASSPRLQGELAVLDAGRAASGASASPGSPYLELQVEGLEAGLDRSPNAQDSVRLGSPFTYPWHVGAARRLRHAASARALAGERAARMEVAADACRRWLELAAATARRRIAADRLQRLDRMLALHEERLRLGEVSGTAVAQLDLAHIQVSSRLAELDAAQVIARNALLTTCAGDVPLPQAGDLAALVGSSRSSGEEDVGRGVDDSALLAASQAAADEDSARAALVAATAWGRPEAEVEWEHFPSLDGVPGFDAYGVRLSLPLPVGASGRLERVAADAEARAAAAAATTARRELEHRLRSADAQAASAERRLQSLRPVLHRLDFMEHSLGEQFRLDVLTYVAYIDGLARLDDVRRDTIEARLDLLSARLELAVFLDDSTLFPLPDTLTEREVP